MAALFVTLPSVYGSYRLSRVFPWSLVPASSFRLGMVYASATIYGVYEMCNDDHLDENLTSVKCQVV